MVEGIAAMAVLFLLLTLIAQAGFLVVAHSTVAVATAAAARRAALPGGEPRAELERLTAEVSAAVPGAENPTASLADSPQSVEVTISFRWSPPGPDLLPITIRSTSRAAKVHPP